MTPFSDIEKAIEITFPQVKKFRYLNSLEEFKMVRYYGPLNFGGKNTSLPQPPGASIFYPSIKIKGFPKLELKPLKFYRILNHFFDKESLSSILEMDYTNQCIILENNLNNRNSSLYPGNRFVPRIDRDRLEIQNIKEVQIILDNACIRLDLAKNLIKYFDLDATYVVREILDYLYGRRKAEILYQQKEFDNIDFFASSKWQKLEENGWFKYSDNQGIIKVGHKETSDIFSIYRSGFIKNSKGGNLYIGKIIETYSDMIGLFHKLPMALFFNKYPQYKAKQKVRTLLATGELKKYIDEAILVDYNALLTPLKLLFPNIEKEISLGLIDMQRMKKLSIAAKLLSRK